jgi:phospholipid-transporting ATPase
VFSDKTGTLTCNVMQFKRFSAGLNCYGTNDEVRQEHQHPNVNFYDPRVARHVSEGNEATIRALLFTATCHTIIIDQKKGAYSSASPDELALVAAARELGFEFYERDENDNIVVRQLSSSGQVLNEYRYQLLNVLEFTSTRKRMSCIYRKPDGSIVLMCKGADAVITDLLSRSSQQSQVYQQT